MHDVFISYSSKDKLVVEAIVNILEGERIKCWIAYRDALAGVEYAASIVRAIKQCKVCVLVLSADSNASKHVLSEVNSVVNYGKPIVPFRIEEFMLQESMEYYLGRTHWLDAITAPLEQHIYKLVESVKRNIEPTETAPLEKTVISQQAETVAAAGGAGRDLFDLKMVKYEDLVKLGYNADKIAIQLVENDYITCSGIDEDNEGTAQQWATFVRNSTETFQYLINGEDKIVGDWSIVALSKDMFADAMQGRLLEKDISYDNTEMISFPDVYYGYVLAISLLPDYRNIKNYMKIIESLFTQIESYAEDGIFFKHWCMNVFSPEIEALIKKLGFTYVCDNIVFGKIYALEFMPLPEISILKKFPRIKELYDAELS